MNRFLLVVVFLAFSQFSFASETKSNYRFAPVHLLATEIRMVADYKLCEHWTLGPSFMYKNYKVKTSGGTYTTDMDVSTYSIGARGNWFMNGVFSSGIYIGPDVTFYSTKAFAKDTAGNKNFGTAEAGAVSVVLGYAWFLENLNLMLGAGPELPMKKTKVAVSDATNNITTSEVVPQGLVLEFTLGTTF